MLGSRADIKDFCHKEPKFTYQDKLIETLEKLNITLSSFNKSNSEEGGDEEMDNFENEVVEEVVETEVEEVVVENNEVEETVVENNEIEETEVVEETETEETSTSENGDDGNFEENPVVEKFTKTFTVELSHDDIRWALYNLIAQYDEEDNDYYGIRAVYDNYFIMCGWVNNKLYKVGYAVDGENVSLEGERQEVFELIVTESEKMAIEKMREDYATLEAQYNALKEFKDNYDASQLSAEKTAVLDSVEYADIKESDEFKALVSEMAKYSVEEIKVKADLLFAASMKKKFNFEATVEKKPHSVGINFNAKPNKKKQAYAGLFDE